MTRLEALERVAEALKKERLGRNDPTIGTSEYAGLRLATDQALDALPGAPAPAQGRTVEVRAVWQNKFGTTMFVAPGSDEDGLGFIWRRLGTTNIVIAEGGE